MLFESAKSLVGRIGPIDRVALKVSPFNPSLYVAEAFYKGGSETAVSDTPEKAEYDAIMAAYAKLVASYRPKNPLRIRKKQLGGISIANPRVFAPLNKAQRHEKSLNEFRESRKYRWGIGCTHDGHPVAIPEDLIYQGIGRDNLYYNNVSGLAADFSSEKAVEKALLSRVLDDAIMRTWIKRLSPYQISPDQHPPFAYERIEYWSKRNRTMVIAQLDSLYGEAYLVTIVGNEFPWFCCGAAITLLERSTAIKEAILKAEGNFGTLSEYNDTHVPNWSEVRTPLDHGLFYAREDNAEQLAFLFEREQLSKPFGRLKEDFSEVAAELDPIKVWLTSENMAVKVVRVLSQKLVPLTHGYGFIHSEHQELQQNDPYIKKQAENLPHFYMW